MRIEFIVTSWTARGVQSWLHIDDSSQKLSVAASLPPSVFFGFVERVVRGCTDVRDVVQLHLPRPLERTGYDPHLHQPLITQLLAAGVEVYAQDSRGALRRMLDATLPVHEPLRPSMRTTCDRGGDLGSVHVFRSGAGDDDLCLCGKRAKRYARPEGIPENAR